MFRNLSTEGHLTDSSSSAAAHGVPSAGLHSQESSWIGLLSRPALSFLHRVLPGRARHRPQSEDFKTRLVQEESEFLRQLDDILPAPHLTYLQCHHSGATSGTIPWHTMDSLRELGIDSEGEDPDLCPQTHIGYLSSVRTVLSHVLLSSQEVKVSGGKDLVSPARQSWPWWGSFWEGETGAQRVSDVSRTREGTETDRLCHQQPAADTKTALTPREWMLGEKSGPADYKEQLANNGGLHMAQNPEGSTVDHQLSTTHLPSCSGAITGEEAPPLTPDPDNGYSSLEEEQLHMARAQSEATAGSTTAVRPLTEQESVSGLVDKRETQQKAEEDPCVEVLAGPQCQNKAIAFIIGCPCSDDDSSQSDTESDDDDDDGFDSEGSSDMSDSMDEDDEASDSDGEDSEAERLWSSLCQSDDPYNPRNFTARLHTVSTRPRTIPPATPPSSTQSTPASSPNLASSSPLPTSIFSSSPPSGHDTWDDSTSASELDEAENARLWSSFSCSSDPYSPFNFQAPLRTRGPSEALPRARVKAKRASQTPPCSPHHDATSPPEYSKEEAEERLDSGFSEAPSCSTSQHYRGAKKVRFCDDVEEFFASCGEEEEDRRGPWEELARDRCRFLRRCQEVEQSIAYCLQPQHRSLVLQRLSVLAVQDA